MNTPARLIIGVAALLTLATTAQAHDYSWRWRTDAYAGSRYSNPPVYRDYGYGRADRYYYPPYRQPYSYPYARYGFGSRDRDCDRPFYSPRPYGYGSWWRDRGSWFGR